MLEKDMQLMPVVLENNTNDGLSEISYDMAESSGEYSPSLFADHHPMADASVDVVDRHRLKENPLVISARREFHSRRFVKAKNLPPDATEHDIRHLLQPLLVKDVQLNRVSETAKVILVTPECLESFPPETRHELNGRFVVMAPSKTEGMLCVAHLPLVYTEHEFRNLVQMFGSIARCFLMRNEGTGKSKGYGFVEYSSKNVAYHAKSRLNGKAIGDTVLHCNWLDSSHVTFRGLHSKCIYVDHLPADYRNLIEFREVFSAIANPSYCQIAIRNGRPLGFGLVEFDCPQDAEEVQLTMNHYQLGDRKIRVTFCIPGYRAMVIYNKLTSLRIGSPPKQPLLPNPALFFGAHSPAYGQLRNTTTQNPQIFQTLETLMRHNRLVSGNNFGIPNVSGSSLHHQKTQLSTQGNDSNLSAALILLLAKQLQTEMGIQQPSLGNNQFLSMLQNIVKKLDPMARQEKIPGQDLQNMISLFVNGMLNIHQTQTSNYACSAGKDTPNVSWKSNGSTSGDSSPYHITKIPLLPNPPALCNINAGLLPRPNCPPLVNGFSSYKYQQHPTSALPQGQESSACQSLQMRQSLFREKQVPFNGQGSPIQTPLLGRKHAFASGNVPPNCHQDSMSQTFPTSSILPDVNFLQHLVALAQLQQPEELQTCSNMQGQVPPSNITYPQCHMQLQGSAKLDDAKGIAGFVNLLHMASSTTQLQGSLPSLNSTSKQDGMLGPCGSSLMVGNSQFGPNSGIPQAIPLSLASTAKTKLPFFPNGCAPFGAVTDHNRKMSIPNGGFSPSLPSTNFSMPLCHQPCYPILVSHLVAGVQQRGSVLGNFWQFSEGAMFNNKQVLGVKRKLQMTLPENNSMAIDMHNGLLHYPCFKQRRY